ncbi:MAG: hypothetical protein KDA41_07720, partial [Planctomycetales bacterium]|nr:hypothetical protein [Planctomycetales bacterium]
MKSSRIVWALALCAPFAACGCGSDHPRTYAVTGTVTFDGAPLADAEVTFIPRAGQGRHSSGTTDAQGVFHLRTYTPDDG